MKKDTGAREGAGPDIASLVSGYQPLAGVTDEMMDFHGEVRPHWQPFLAALAALGKPGINRRFEGADQYLRDSGVYYRVYDDAGGGERQWPLSHVPLIIDSAEWEELERGLIQRATLLEAVLADAYGEGRLVHDGALPAAVIAGSPEYLRPLVGVRPRGDHHLWLYAADIGRGPDGRFWVLSDRTQAPSGAGYAIENRIALSRALPDTYRAFNVRRVAPFFEGLRAALSEMNRRDDTRVGLLTPGPLNETYFEHAYLARYLGFLLVQPEDLAVRGDDVFVQTVSGLRRMDVLMRRLDADFADPLELNSSSRIGVPGLVRAVRAGRVVVANGLGSGVVESRALLSFLPALARRVLGEELLLPNVATWWCGQERERETVLERLDELVIASAFGTLVPGLGPDSVRMGHDLRPDERDRIVDLVRDRGVDIVGQEAARLSTTPVWTGGRLEPRPYIMRCYVARTVSGWAVMPGAFCRVSDALDAHAVSMQSGGRSADVWVTSDQPVEPVTLLPSPENVAIRRSTGMLPSRTADNMFWLGRYIERAEGTVRLVRALASRLAEGGRRDDPVARRFAELLQEAVAAPATETSPAVIAHAAMADGRSAGSALAVVTQAVRAASVIRDRLSPDTWRTLSDLDDLLKRWAILPNAFDLFEAAQRSLRLLTALSGYMDENMTRLDAWRFLELGRRIERGLTVCWYARRTGLEADWPEGLDALLELVDSQITYRSRYVMTAASAPVLDLVLLDENNPRSVGFQIAQIDSCLMRLPAHEPGGPLNAPERVLSLLRAEIGTADARTLEAEAVEAWEEELALLSDALSALYFTPRRTALLPETLA